VGCKGRTCFEKIKRITNMPFAIKELEDVFSRPEYA
jgi:hypothetical protein